MMLSLASLRFGGVILLVLAFVAGMASAALWLTSFHSWQQHLQRAQTAGETLFDALYSGIELPPGLIETSMPDEAQTRAAQGKFERLKNVPRPARVTHLTVGAGSLDQFAPSRLKLAILSPDLQYPISELDLSAARSPRDTLGKVTELVATYCSDALLFANIADTPWRRFEGDQIWGCEAAPRDNRLAASLLGLISLFAFWGIAANSSAHFTDFADLLRARRRVGGSDTFPAKGPTELQTIIEAVNGYRDMERQHLAERALVLSGVSHDLGTPATRLRLRAELIADPKLRAKFEADIDQMTGIIESVLTYTRAELSTEEPRQLSLTSLVDAVVADYADVGRPVVLAGTSKVVIEGGQSIFMSRRGRTEIREDNQVILQARPVALQRALSNLIDNALKYGRRAVVHLETDAAQAHILVTDEGGQSSVSELETMTAPFRRGENASPIEGYGMGLTIASAIALEHGGGLSFETGKTGLIARLSIARV